MPKTTIEIIFKFIAKNPASILISGGIIAILLGIGFIAIGWLLTGSLSILIGFILIFLGITIHEDWLNARYN